MRPPFCILNPLQRNARTVAQQRGSRSPRDHHLQFKSTNCCSTEGQNVVYEATIFNQIPSERKSTNCCSTEGATSLLGLVSADTAAQPCDPTCSGGCGVGGADVCAMRTRVCPGLPLLEKAQPDCPPTHRAHFLRWPARRQCGGKRLMRARGRERRRGPARPPLRAPQRCAPRTPKKLILPDCFGVGRPSLETGTSQSTPRVFLVSRNFVGTGPSCLVTIP